MNAFTEKFGALVEELYRWAPRLVGAILALLIGLWIIGGLTKWIRKALDRSGLDRDVIPFLTSMINVLLKVMLIISIAGMLGIETTSFVALLGLVGLAIGAALQGTLGHLASGIMIMLFKPYKVGDLVQVQGQLGNVDEIHIFNTVITAPDNKKIVIPNGIATGGIIVNLSANKYLRVDLNAAMPYEEDFEKVRNIILNALKNVPKVRENPTPVIEIEKFNEDNVLLAVRPFANTEDYWDVYFNAYKSVKEALGNAGIKVAYPRTDIVIRDNK